SSAAIPPIPGVKENLGGFVMTNREVLDLEAIPERLAVIGAFSSERRRDARRRPFPIPPILRKTPSSRFAATV
ncbi:MAG: hypothetical protein IIW01_10555, partial [Thermoguttaceae bacterium]|nr:hypothetical protein [Thermoguttaceae bacterium]